MREHPKLSPNELRQKLQENMSFGNYCYRHHTGNVYKITGRSFDCKTNTLMAHYTLEYVPGDASDFNFMSGDEDKHPFNITFSRPVDDFVEPRFVKVQKTSLFLASKEEHKIIEMIKDSKENRL